MLQTLHIQNFALIKELNMDFRDGITIFTGETGAGKSILMGAVGMLAGNRAAMENIRQGMEYFLVEGSFYHLAQPALTALLEAQNIADTKDGQLVISRKFNRNGRGNIVVNGTITTIGVLKQIAAFLLDIHGQYDNYLIFDKAFHRELLDQADEELKQQYEQYRGYYRRWHRLYGEWQELVKGEQEKERKLDILQYQIQEIGDAHLQPEEDDALENKLNRLSHAEKITEGLRTINELLNESSEQKNGAIPLLQILTKEIAQLISYEKQLEPVSKQIETVLYELEDIDDAVQQYTDALSFDEDELAICENRYAQIRQLKKKYGLTINEILQFQEDADTQLAELTQSEERISILQIEVMKLEEDLRLRATALCATRSAINEQVCTNLMSALQDMGIANPRITFRIEPMTELNEYGTAGIELYFSANRGEDLQPLAKIGSGGEISRIALALKATLAIPLHKTMIFDEIDVGISGEVGIQVARKIQQLSTYSQIFCITHLPQTASIADHHYLLYKTEGDGRTVTQIKRLSAEEHIAAIAKMIAGDHISTDSLEIARQLVRQLKKP